jgi:hypothetical protein
MVTAMRGVGDLGRKKNPPDPLGEKTSTKVYAALLRKAKIVATHRVVELFDYLHSLLSPLVEKDYERMIREEAKSGEE